jgi:hypothetical protein
MDDRIRREFFKGDKPVPGKGKRKAIVAMHELLWAWASR